MAQLTEADKNELSTEIADYISRIWVECNLSKAQLRAGIDVFDVNLETAEATILSSVSAAAQTWLTSHPTISRFVLEKVAQKRREEL